MWRFTCLPRNVYDFLYPFKPLFRCSQARHFVIFCWLLVAIIRDPGAGTLKGLCPYLPPHLSYWALIRMLRSGKWDAQAVMNGMAEKVLRSLPPAADGKLYLIGDTTSQAQTGQETSLGPCDASKQIIASFLWLWHGGVGGELERVSHSDRDGHHRSRAQRTSKHLVSSDAPETLNRLRGCVKLWCWAMPVIRPMPPSS